MINIITDSTADLSPEIASDFNLTIVPLLVTIGGKVYRDGVDIHQKELFALVEKNGELPKTAAPSVGEFTKAFDQAGESIFIGISSKLSATVQNARIAADMLPPGRVRVVDSQNLSSGVGLLVLLAAELRDRDLSTEQIEKEIRLSACKVRTSFVIDTMEYLFKGGRCTARCIKGYTYSWMNLSHNLQPLIPDASLLPQPAIMNWTWNSSLRG